VTGPAAIVEDRVRQVRAAAAKVRDPEIDETAAELDFVVDVQVSGGAVAVSVRLPTYWCPVNFAWIMAEAMREAVLALPWVTGFELRLVDHFADAQVSAGITAGKSFESVFPDHASGDLTALKRDFALKAMLMRQAPLIAALRACGLDERAILSATVVDMKALATRAPVAEVWVALLEKRREAGLPADEAAPAICDAQGAPVSDLTLHTREIRRVATSAASSGEMCRLLVASRRMGPAGCTAGTPVKDSRYTQETSL